VVVAFIFFSCVVEFVSSCFIFIGVDFFFTDFHSPYNSWITEELDVRQLVRLLESLYSE
jgi:hypothetical protein